MATVEVVKRLMEAIIFKLTARPIISDEKSSMVDDDWQVDMEALDCHETLAGAPVDTPSVCEMPGGPSLKIDPQTQEAVSIYSAFCSSIGLMMILTRNISIAKPKD
jgi:hypothetical protein